MGVTNHVPTGMILQVWGPYKWPKINGFAWGYFTTISGVIWDPTHNCFFGPTLLCFPKNPDMSLERDFPYTPILGIEAINPTLGRGLDS